jgi:hypothetical protein
MSNLEDSRVIFQGEVSPTLADGSNLTVKSRLMKKTQRIALTLALAGLCATAQAGWTEIQTFDDGMRVFVDKATAQRNSGDTAQLSHLVRWGEPQEEVGISPYRSTVVRASYDCAGKHEKYLGSTSYAEPMGNGAQVAADDNEAEVWYSISEGSMEEKLWKIACRP